MSVQIISFHSKFLANKITLGSGNLAYGMSSILIAHEISHYTAQIFQFMRFLTWKRHSMRLSERKEHRSNVLSSAQMLVLTWAGPKQEPELYPDVREGGRNSPPWAFTFAFKIAYIF